MPLVSAKDFPQIFSQSSNAGLAQGLQQLIGGVGQRQQEEKKLAEQAKQARIAQELKTIGAQFNRVRSIEDPTTQRTQLLRLAQSAIQRGENPGLYEEALSIEDPDERNLFLTQVITRADSFQDKAAEANKLQFGGQEILQDEGGNKFFATSRRNPQTGRVESVLSPIGHNNPQQGKLEIVSGSGVTPQGRVDIAAQIEEKKTEEALAKKKGEAEIAAETEPQLAADVSQAQAAVKKADALFEAVEKTNLNIANLQEAKQALLDGAGTGPIERLWPSFKAASVRLDNTQGRLGLDIVGATTFGALSKGELDLAKAVALPSGLPEEELAKWLEDRISAQESKSEYLTRQAIFLSEKNEKGKQNTKADWAKSEKEALDRALVAMDVTEEDIKETMRVNNMDRSQVLREIRRRFESGGS